MEPTHQIILESLPPKSPRSKLEPHRELIRELRRKGRTYREVAQLFHERLGLYVAPSDLAMRPCSRFPDRVSVDAVVRLGSPIPPETRPPSFASCFLDALSQ